jgi:diguanylate cyclase (GGDEF)-like protein
LSEGRGSREEPRGAYKRIFAALFAVARAVNEGRPLDGLLKDVAHALRDLVDADACTILLFDNSSRSLLVTAASGLKPKEDAALTFRMGEGLEGFVAETGRGLNLGDLRKDGRFGKRTAGGKDVVSVACVPLQAKEGVIGTVTVASSRPHAFGEENEELLAYLGLSIVKDLENARLYRLCITDSLTTAYNRQYLYQRLPEELERCRRYGDPFSVVLLDVDHFKRFNDTYGHAAGDFVLKALVHTVNQAIREVDDLVRYGGEEFLLLMPKTPLTGAAEAAERIRTGVEQTNFVWADHSLRVTISLGVTDFRTEMRDEEALLKRVDELLYEAKSAGRNQVVAR